MPELPPDFEQLLRLHCPAIDDGDALDVQAPLWTLGMDSLEMLGLIVDVESEYRVTVPETLLNGETFDTPETLWRALSTVLPETVLPEDSVRSEDAVLPGDTVLREHAALPKEVA